MLLHRGMARPSLKCQRLATVAPRAFSTSAAERVGRSSPRLPPPLPASRRRPHFQGTVSRLLTTTTATGQAPGPVSNLPLKGFATGALAGVLGSWLGLGGGFVSLPILTMALRLTQHQAHATSLCAVTATGLAGVCCVCVALVHLSLCWTGGLSK